jgi:hypothetical protein
MRIIIIAILACLIESATAAEVALPTAPPPVFAAPDPYPSRFLLQGVFFELGARYWFSSGNYSKDLFAGGASANGGQLVSRLSFTGLTDHAGELFGSIKQRRGWFLNWNVGFGKTVAGNLTDQDFAPFITPFSSTLSAQQEGSIGYATIDLGYNVVGSPAWQVGPFVGVNFLRDTINATGCTQQANNLDVCAGIPPTGPRIISQRADWTSVRVGVAGAWNVTNQFKLSGNAAWLPFVSLDATDSHVLRADLPNNGNTPETGTGSGVQLEAIASYAISDDFSIGVGGRYWYMQAQGRADFRNLIDPTTGLSVGFQPESVKAERYGVFLQGTYTFSLPDIGHRSPWRSCC